MVRRYFGISPKRITLLDERTKVRYNILFTQVYNLPQPSFIAGCLQRALGPQSSAFLFSQIDLFYKQHEEP